MAVELEFINFKTPSSDGYKDVATHGLGDMASYLETNSPKSLRTITSGMFGYSATRPVHYKDYFYEIFDKSREFGCDIEGWHTESGPGFYEAVSNDRESLLRYSNRVSGSQSLRRSTNGG